MQPLSLKLWAKPLLIKKSANLGITPPTMYTPPRFYKYVQVIHMVEGSFNKSLVSSKDINNDLKFVIKNEIVRFSMDGSILKDIIIEDAFKKSKRKLIDDYKTINLIGTQDVSLIEDVFFSVTEGINNENISFSLSQSLEILKKNLVLSEMVYI